MPIPHLVPAVIATPSQGARYSAEATALFARMTTQPSDVRERLIDSLIGALKTAGIWSVLDVFYVHAAHTSQAARLNWKAAQYDASIASSPTFTTDRGYAGDGSSSYLDTTFAPSTAAGIYTLNSASMFCWSRTDGAGGAGSGRDMGTTGLGSNFNIKTTAPAYYFRGNSGSALSAAAPTVAVGLFGWTRENASNVYPIVNGVRGSVITSAATSIGTGNLCICSGAGSFSDRQIAAAGAGSYLTSAQVAALNAALTTYLTAIGAA